MTRRITYGIGQTQHNTLIFDSFYWIQDKNGSTFRTR